MILLLLFVCSCQRVPAPETSTKQNPLVIAPFQIADPNGLVMEMDAAGHTKLQHAIWEDGKSGRLAMEDGPTLTTQGTVSYGDNVVATMGDDGVLKLTDGSLSVSIDMDGKFLTADGKTISWSKDGLLLSDGRPTGYTLRPWDSPVRRTASVLLWATTTPLGPPEVTPINSQGKRLPF